MGDWEEPVRDWEERVKRARDATVALYLDEPSPGAAYMLQIFEQTVAELRRQRREAERRREWEGAGG